jgi:hypothetical protein
MRHPPGGFDEQTGPDDEGLPTLAARGVARASFPRYQIKEHVSEPGGGTRSSDNEQEGPTRCRKTRADRPA